MATQVLQQRGRPLWAGQARRGAVGGHQVASVAQLGVVLLPTLLAVVELPAGWLALLQLALQMVLLVEHGLTQGTVLVLLLHGDSGQEPEQTQTRLMRILPRAVPQPADRPVNGQCWSQVLLVDCVFRGDE